MMRSAEKKKKKIQGEEYEAIIFLVFNNNTIAVKDNHKVKYWHSIDWTIFSQLGTEYVTQIARTILKVC